MHMIFLRGESQESHDVMLRKQNPLEGSSTLNTTNHTRSLTISQFYLVYTLAQLGHVEWWICEQDIDMKSQRQVEEPTHCSEMMNFFLELSFRMESYT